MNYVEELFARSVIPVKRFKVNEVGMSNESPAMNHFSTTRGCRNL